jgi:Fe-S-cluster containining protein
LTYYWLSTHLGYACRHSGACCRAGWPIPIEPSNAAAVRAAIDDGRITAPLTWVRPAPQAPADVAGILALSGSGACVFHRPSPAGEGGCVIHAMRPASCAHFPYVCAIDPRGVHVTLSHFCPTAAELLFEAHEPARIVEGPPVPVGSAVPEGLDAREALPPAAHAAQLLSWDDVSRFEQELVRRLAADRSTPVPPDTATFERAHMAAAPEWPWRDAPVDLHRLWDRLVAPAWAAWTPVIGRYLAARAHASWAIYLGERLSAVERHVDLARTVLQVEAVRQCEAMGTRLNRPLLKAAIGETDRLLLHHAVPERLYRSTA